jgi:hypothetical protein
MFSFDIVKKSDIDDTFRVSHIKADFDVKSEHSNEHFVGVIETPEEWSIGLIFGGSGTGKSSIAKELFGDRIVSHYDYTHKSVVDDMPSGCSMSDIEKTFYSVGFGSVPSWLKPYSVLSTGEKMRVDLARALLSAEDGDLIVFDEFTSVVDRTVAHTACIAINKAIKRSKKKIRFIAVTCHSDVVEWLQPDWAFCTDTMRPFAFRRATSSNSKFASAAEKNGRSLGVITI